MTRLYEITGKTSGAVDLDRLLKLRLVVGRYGEMDLNRWWNCRGMLGHQGAVVLKRGFPATHSFAQARVVFEVARSRCRELFNPPGCMTLWNLPAEVEDGFEEHWQTWLDEGERWRPIFERLASLKEGALITALTSFGLLTLEQREALGKLRRSAENRALPLPGTYHVDDEVITMLAAGFARGEPGSPTIPYAKFDS